MKLYTMKCVKDPEEYMLGEVSHFVHLENEWERIAYLQHIGGLQVSPNDFIWWDGFMTACLETYITDRDMYGYILPERTVEVGDTYEDADELVWERIE